MGSRSGLGRFGGKWALGPVFDALEASGLQVRSWMLWRQVGSRSGLGSFGGEKTIDLCQQSNTSSLNNADRSLVTLSTELSLLSAATAALLQNIPLGKSNA